MIIKKLLLTACVFCFIQNTFSQETEITLKCEGKEEGWGTKFRKYSKDMAFDLIVDLKSGKIKGGYADFIVMSDNFSASVSAQEIAGKGIGKTFLPKAVIFPEGFYSLNRNTGSYYIHYALHFDETKDISDTTLIGSCTVATQKF